MGIHPIPLAGVWDEGWALDQHVLSSEYMGEDIYGRAKFENQYRELGLLLKQFKYDRAYQNINPILQLAAIFLNTWNVKQKVDMILPVPPTKQRDFQPTEAIARAIAAHYKADFDESILKKTTTMASKDMQGDKNALDGSICATKRATRTHSLLIVDDLYDTGATLTQCVRVLREDPLLEKIYVLTMTKTKPK